MSKTLVPPSGVPESENQSPKSGFRGKFKTIFSNPGNGTAESEPSSSEILVPYTDEDIERLWHVVLAFAYINSSTGRPLNDLYDKLVCFSERLDFPTEILLPLRQHWLSARSLDGLDPESLLPSGELQLWLLNKCNDLGPAYSDRLLFLLNTLRSLKGHYLRPSQTGTRKNGSNAAHERGYGTIPTEHAEILAIASNIRPSANAEGSGLPADFLIRWLGHFLIHRIDQRPELPQFIADLAQSCRDLREGRGSVDLFPSLPQTPDASIADSAEAEPPNPDRPASLEEIKGLFSQHLRPEERELLESVYWIRSQGSDWMPMIKFLQGRSGTLPHLGDSRFSTLDEWINGFAGNSPSFSRARSIVARLSLSLDQILRMQPTLLPAVMAARREPGGQGKTELSQALNALRDSLESAPNVIREISANEVDILNYLLWYLSLDELDAESLATTLKAGAETTQEPSGSNGIKATKIRFSFFEADGGKLADVGIRASIRQSFPEHHEFLKPLIAKLRQRISALLPEALDMTLTDAIGQDLQVIRTLSRVKSVDEVKRAEAIAAMEPFSTFADIQNPYSLSDEEFRERFNPLPDNFPFHSTHFDAAFVGIVESALAAKADELKVSVGSPDWNKLRLDTGRSIIRWLDPGYGAPHLVDSVENAGDQIYFSDSGSAGFDWFAERAIIGSGLEVLTTGEEYFPMLEANLGLKEGADFHRLPNFNGDPDLYCQAIERAFVENPRIGYLLVSNLSRMGTLFPLTKILEMRDRLRQKQPSRPFHVIVDACQGFGRRRFRPEELTFDVLLASSGKGTEVGHAGFVLLSKNFLRSQQGKRCNPMDFNGTKPPDNFGILNVACSEPARFGLRGHIPLKERERILRGLSVSFVRLVDALNRANGLNQGDLGHIHLLGTPEWARMPNGDPDPERLTPIFLVRVEGIHRSYVCKYARDHGVFIGDHEIVPGDSETFRITLHPRMDGDSLKALGYVLRTTGASDPR